MVRCGELDSCDYEDKGAAHAQTGQTTENHGAGRVARLDGSETNDAGCEEEEPNEDGKTDCSQFCAGITVQDCAQTARNPKWLLSGDEQERISFEERSRPGFMRD